MAEGVRTTCPYCGVGCGVVASLRSDGSVSVKGDPDHPANFGRLCSKGSALAETVGFEDRLLYPEIRGQRASWENALDLVATTLSDTIARHGPDSVAFYVSGQLLTEDYYVANKLMKGFIGSANIDTNSRLCMASSVAGHRRAFGADTVPGTYEDLELADLVVLTGSNLAWCHPVLYQRLTAAKERRPGMKVVVVDPRRTVSTEIADLHLPIAPDRDTALFVGLLRFLAESGRISVEYVESYTNNIGDALAAARLFTPARVAFETGLSVREVDSFYRLFAESEHTVTVYSQGVNQSTSGTDKVNAIINCHLATGRIGRPGMGPFSVTGQPNAMGGREVGGLANMLAAHMDIENDGHRDLVQRFWRSPSIPRKPGLKAVEMFRAVADGRIKALWIMATNPVDSMPDADAVRTALEICPFVVVSDIAGVTDTLRYAHVKLPSAGWGEKDGTVTNSERRISRQRPFLAAPGEARPDWWQITDVARRMGFADAFAYLGPADIFREHAELSSAGNGGTRDFDIGAHAGIGAFEYEALEPFQWPASASSSSTRKTAGHGADSGENGSGKPGAVSGPEPRAQDNFRFFANGGFYTPDRRARFVAIVPQSSRGFDSEYPMVLNTGRVRDHWHTMTRTGKSPRLSAHMAEPYAELHPEDAARLGINHAELAYIESHKCRVVVRALITPRQQPGSVFGPMHWTDQFTAKGRINAIVAPLTDPVSGQPALKNTAIRVRPFEAAFYGFAATVRRPVPRGLDYWALARAPHGWRLELAHGTCCDDPEALFRRILNVSRHGDVIAYHDIRHGDHRLAAFEGETLLGTLHMSPRPVALSRSFAVEQLGRTHQDIRARYRIVAGRAGAGQQDIGAVICACFGVGAGQIAAAVRAGCTSEESIGKALSAGTNCGACRAEIRTILAASRAVAAE